MTVATLSACSSDPVNPSFALTVRDANQLLDQMADEPGTLERPVVILGGIHDPGVAAPRLAGDLEDVLKPGAPIIAVSFFFSNDFEKCRRKAIEAVEREWPSDDPDATVEVDVIGVSMGGLVGRYASRPRTDGQKRLRVHRLFTISTPHRGARMAMWPTIDARIHDMRQGSAFLALLNDHPAPTDPEVIAYARLDDAVVGAENASPPAVVPFWVATPPLELAHIESSADPRIVADIVRRLRGEITYSNGTAAPLPRRTKGESGGTGDPPHPE